MKENIIHVPVTMTDPSRLPITVEAPRPSKIPITPNTTETANDKQNAHDVSSP